MVTKKPAPIVRSRPERKRPATPRSELTKPLPTTAEGEDAETQAQKVMELLDVLGQQSDPEAHKLRASLIAVIKDFADKKARGENLEKARAELLLNVTRFEVMVADVMLRGVKKLRDRFTKATRQIGTKQAGALAVRAAAEGLEHIATGLEKLIAANKSGDAELRKEAHAHLAEAKAKMESGRS